tara:strand:- start:90 stop:398 length:309 start_codon:yes stop_codon:yes gene_type:complete
MTFNDLVFEQDDVEEAVLSWYDPTEHAHYIFDNNYGVSVIRGPYTYGGLKGLYELAVLYMDSELNESELVYDTPVTNDLVGHLTPDDVTRLMKQVSELPPRK